MVQRLLLKKRLLLKVIGMPNSIWYCKTKRLLLKKTRYLKELTLLYVWEDIRAHWNHPFDISSAIWGLPRGHPSKESSCQCRRGRRLRFDPWVGKIPWRRKWQPTPVFLPGGSHGQRSLVGYPPWGRRSQTRLSTHAGTHGTLPGCCHAGDHLQYRRPGFKALVTFCPLWLFT